MIHIYGDSHARFGFQNLPLPHKNNYSYSITMFRIGRDNIIINFNQNDIQNNDIIVVSYGEIDCRCQIQRQINLGGNEDDIIRNLVDRYITTIKKNTTDLGLDVKIIIVGVIPPTKQTDYESLHGPITHEYPFVGTDEERVRYTNKVNGLLKKMAIDNNFIYFDDPYRYYTRPDGTLKHELSDTIVHIRDNSHFLQCFIDLCKNI